MNARLQTTNQQAQLTEANSTILIVEDEKVLRRLLVLTLRGEGYTVLDADNGEVGLQLALKHHPRLVLLDILMPHMNGIGMLELLRKDEWGKAAEVMLLTNLGEADSMEKAKAYGVTDYLVKSEWSLDELAQRIKKKLNHA